MNEPTPIELPAAPGTPFDGSVRPYSLRGTSLDGPGEQTPYAFLRSELSGLVVEAIKSNGSRQSASVCVAVRQNGAASQLWRLDFFGRLHSALGNLVLETGAKGSLEIRPPVESAASQLWQFTDQNEIENTKSGLLLTSKNGSSLSKSLTVAKRRIGLSQTWLFEPAEPGTNIDARQSCDKSDPEFVLARKAVCPCAGPGSMRPRHVRWIRTTNITFPEKMKTKGTSIDLRATITLRC